jgi:hypothetical protein
MRLIIAFSGVLVLWIIAAVAWIRFQDRRHARLVLFFRKNARPGDLVVFYDAVTRRRRSGVVECVYPPSALSCSWFWVRPDEAVLWERLISWIPAPKVSHVAET